MKIVLAGGTGHIGRILKSEYLRRAYKVLVLTRNPSPNSQEMKWDGKNPGPWTREIDGCDIVINLAGRSVDCRYNKKNLWEMLSSRINSTRAIGLSIEKALKLPKIWLQMSTATIYSHRFDKDNDEYEGEIGGCGTRCPGLLVLEY